VLQSIVGDEAVVCPKISLGESSFARELFYAATGDYGKNRSWMNRIDRKHVDFLICDPGSMAPALAVELDDGSHATAPPRVNQGNRIWSEFRSFDRAFVPRVARTWTRTIRKKTLT
jgi:hypothetical protein